MSDHQSEVLEKFQKIVALISKNQINKLNAFENRLCDIDSLLLFFNSQSLKEEEWRQVSTIVDACGKIYGYCIDHIFEEVIKILGICNWVSDKYRIPETHQPRGPLNLLQNTLESNESALNSTDFDLIQNYDPCFNQMRHQFDCSKSTSMFLNNSFVNSNLDIVFLPEDPVASTDLFALSPEINLEGLLTFSLNELIGEELCIKLNSVIEKSGSVVKSFDQVWKEIKSPDFDVIVLDYSSHEQESVQAMDLCTEIQADLDEDDVNGSAFEIEMSENVFRMKDFLEEGVTKKKRRLKKKHRPYCKLRFALAIKDIEIDSQDKNLFCPEKLPLKRQRSEEKGFKETRLEGLFTRKKKFLGVDHIKKLENENFDPLCLDPIDRIDLPPVETPVTRPAWDILKTKQKILEICQRRESRKFLDLVDELSKCSESFEVSNLSIHSCFTALLYLAIESGLSFVSSGECNFTINHSDV